MSRPIEFLVEVTVTVEASEVSTDETHVLKERAIRRAIEDIDPSIGIFQVESVQ